jgi:translation elongation factor P/translation initiation factor 5A|tara:strand:+ start:1116 stop:1310 length:195 start_codon:yes stop_codon:yes gene_type:complete
MSEYREVLIEWKDEPDKQYLTTVAIDKEWTEGEDDDNVFFYFSDEQEFEQAKLNKDEFEFRIVG